MVAPAKALSGIRVVIVDDEADALELLTFVLEAHGAEVAAFDDPVAALQELTRQPADVLVSDLYMPRMNGWELLEEARKSGMTAPAAAITAHPSLENRKRSQAVGFGACIGKPVTPGELVGVVRELAGRG